MLTQQQVQQIKTIGNETDTARGIINYLNDRKRFRPIINLNKLKWDLVHSGKKFVDSEFYNFWTQFENIQVGKMRGKAKFRWHFNFFDLAKLAMVPNSQGVPASTEQQVEQEQPMAASPAEEVTVRQVVKSRPGPKKNAKRKTLTRKTRKVKRGYKVSEVPRTNGAAFHAPAAVNPATTAPLSIVINLPANTKTEDVAALVQLVNTIGK